MMRYLSVCSGIEAATTAWHHMGWQPVAFSEIEAFPSAVLKYHWPQVPNRGDFTTIGDEYAGSVDLIIGGTPCQSFSVAGKRAGLDDPRGNLTLEFVRLCDRIRPRWILWENVPGVLSIDRGETFAQFLQTLGQIGYGWAYAVLDAQHFGVPQRRRRVFVVGCLGGWHLAAAVLSECPGVCRDTETGAEAGEEVAKSLRGQPNASFREDTDTYVASNAEGSTGLPFLTSSNIGKCVNNQTPLLSHTLTGNGFDASEDGTGRGTPLVAFQQNASGRNTGMVAMRESGQGYWMEDDKAGTLRAEGENRASRPSHVVAFSHCDNGRDVGELAPTLRSRAGVNTRDAGNGNVAMATQSTVRRLTPVECERLQGFPDNHTRIPWRGKPAEECPDGPRYKAIGNSMAVPVMRWIGERIQAVESIINTPTESERER